MFCIYYFRVSNGCLVTGRFTTFIKRLARWTTIWSLLLATEMWWIVAKWWVFVTWLKIMNIFVGFEKSLWFIGTGLRFGQLSHEFILSFNGDILKVDLLFMDRNILIMTIFANSFFPFQVTIISNLFLQQKSQMCIFLEHFLIECFYLLNE